MLPTLNIQTVPSVHCGDEHANGVVGFEAGTRSLNPFASERGSGTVSVHPKITDTHGRPHVEFGNSSIESGDSLTIIHDLLSGHHCVSEQTAHELIDVLVCQVLSDRCGLVAGAATVHDPAGIRRAFSSTRRRAHQHPAPGASNDPREQARPAITAWGSGIERLRSVEQLAGNDSGVRCLVDVPADAEFAEVHAVTQQVSYPSGRHLGAFSDASHAVTTRLAREQVTDEVCLSVWDEPACDGVTGVPRGGLPALPYPGTGCVLAQGFESVGVFFAFPFGVRQEDGSQEPAVAGAGIKVFGGANDPSASCFDAVPAAQLLADVPAKTTEVRNDDGLELSGFDALNGAQQARALLQRQATGHVQLRRQHDHTGTVKPRSRFDSGDLIAVGVDVLRSGDPAAHVADSDDPCPCFHGGDHTPQRKPVALGLAVADKGGAVTVLVDSGIREHVHLTTAQTANGAALIVHRTGQPPLRLDMPASVVLTLADEFTRHTEGRA